MFLIDRKYAQDVGKSVIPKLIKNTANSDNVQNSDNKMSPNSEDGNATNVKEPSHISENEDHAVKSDKASDEFENLKKDVESNVQNSSDGKNVK